MKAGDLVRLTCFPPIDLGMGARPGPGILVAAGEPNTKYEKTWWVLLGDKVYAIHSAGFEVINEGR